MKWSGEKLWGVFDSAWLSWGLYNEFALRKSSLNSVISVKIGMITTVADIAGWLVQPCADAGELKRKKKKTLFFRLMEAKILDALSLLSIRLTWKVGVTVGP